MKPGDLVTPNPLTLTLSLRNKLWTEEYTSGVPMWCDFSLKRGCHGIVIQVIPGTKRSESEALVLVPEGVGLALQSSLVVV